MSKLTKLINHPIIFFKDAYLNKINPTRDIKKKQQKKATTVNKKSTETKKSLQNLILDHMNTSEKPIYHLIHTGEGLTHGIGHVDLWLPFFLSSGESFAVLVRHIALYQYIIEKYPDINIVYAKDVVSIEKFLSDAASLRAIYYLSNTGNLIHTLRYNDYKHIFLGHGDSDKSASAHKFFRVYDEIWVAGQAHIDRFQNAGFNTKHMTFIKVGRPLLSPVLKSTQVNWKKRIGGINVLYLPTWEGILDSTDCSSLKISTLMLSMIHKHFNLSLSIKFHPATGSRETLFSGVSKEVAMELKEHHVDFEIASASTPIDQLILNSNIYICDISAVVSECIAANAPIFIYIPRDKTINIARSNMDYEDYAYTFSSIEELREKLQRVLSGDDYLMGARKKALNYLISEKETLRDEFFVQLRKISSKGALAQ